MPAKCEIAACGVLAVGRCEGCGKAYCRTHAGTTNQGRTELTNCCRPCAEISDSQRAEARQVARLLSSPGTIRAIAAQMAATDCGGLVPRSLTRRRHIPGNLFRKSRSVEEIVELDPAWPVGKLSWMIDISGKGDLQREFMESGVTPAGEIVLLSSADLNNPRKSGFSGFGPAHRVENHGLDMVSAALVEIARAHGVSVAIPEATTEQTYPSLDAIMRRGEDRNRDTMHGSPGVG